MAQPPDWAILGRDPSQTTVVADDTSFGYDLLNLTCNEAIVYGHRQGNNINLVWGDPGKSDNVHFWRESGAGPIKYDEPIAINIRNGGWLCYQTGRQGINLGWGKSACFEWRIVGGPAGEVVPTMRPVALYNQVENDVLIYEPRDWGINCKWSKDSGKYQEIGDAIKTGETAIDIGKKIGSWFG
jgi:hypothetical protein